MGKAGGCRLKRGRAETVYLVATGGMALAESIMFTTYAIYYVQMLGLNPLQLILVGTFLEATAMLLEVPTGVVADSFGRRLSVIIGYFVLGAAYTFEGSVPFLLPGALFVGVVAAEMVRGLGWTFVSGAFDAWIADEVGEERLGGVLLRESQLRQVMGVVGLGVSVALAAVALYLPYLVGGLIHLGLGLYLLRRMPETGFRPQVGEDGARLSPLRQMGETLAAGVRAVRGRALLMLLLGAGFFAGAASEGLDRLWEAHFLQTFTLPAAGNLPVVVWFGGMRLGAMLIGILVTAALRRTRLAGGDGRLVSLALLAMTALRIGGTVAFGLAGGFWWALAAFWGLQAAGAGLSPLYRAWLNRQLEPRTRATVLSSLSLMDALGQSAGGPLVGAVGVRLSLRAAMVAAGALLAPLLAIFGMAARGTAAPGAAIARSEGLEG